MTAETEFELRKNSLVQSGRRKPVELVAAFLLAVSQINKREGRDANVIGASWQCALVADQLELSIDLLARILVEFEKRGLIESCPSGDLRLKDLATLEGLAAEPVTSSLLRDISDRPQALQLHPGTRPGSSRQERRSTRYLRRRERHSTCGGSSLSVIGTPATHSERWRRL